MAIEAVFGSGLGERQRRSPESLILEYRERIQLPETSLLAFARGLCDVLTGLATAASEFVLAPEGARFYFLLIVRPATLRLDLPQQVLVPLWRSRRITIREQMATAAARIACQLADLGTPDWTLDASGPRQPAKLDPLDLL